MKYTTDGVLHRLELTRRNLLTLLAKLDDPASARTLIDPDWNIAVVAVQDAEHYSDRAPGGVVAEHDPGVRDCKPDIRVLSAPGKGDGMSENAGEPECCARLLLRVYTGISDEEMAAHLAECDDCKEIRGEHDN